MDTIFFKYGKGDSLHDFSGSMVRVRVFKKKLKVYFQANDDNPLISLLLDPSLGEIVPSSGFVLKKKEEPEQAGESEDPGQPSIHDLDVPLHEVLDQKTLREIFPGICTPTIR